MTAGLPKTDFEKRAARKQVDRRTLFCGRGEITEGVREMDKKSKFTTHQFQASFKQEMVTRKQQKCTMIKTSSLVLSAVMLAVTLVILLVAALGILSMPLAHADTYDVSNTGASGPGSLRQAILDANENGGHDTITFKITGTIVLTDTLPQITDDVTITGPGTGSLAISGNDSHQVFNIANSTAVTITGVTIQDGKVSAGAGGGISNAGTLTLNNCTVCSNTTNIGGGIYNKGDLVLTNSAIYNNTAGGTEGLGGGIYNEGTLALTNCTVSGNTGTNIGGICIDEGGTMTLNNCTISNNTAEDEEGIGGIGIHDAAMVVKNTIIAGNSGGNCYSAGSTITSGGYNIESTDTCGLDATDDITNSTTIATTLGPLQDNGGPTWTHALLDGSPAIDVIPEGGTGYNGSPATDQRGVSRPQPPKGYCDIGAYEYESTTTPTPTATHTTTSTPAVTDTPTSTPTPTATPTETSTPGVTDTPTNTLTPTDTPTVTSTPISTDTPTITPTPTNTPTTDPCDASNLINAINTANGNEGADTIDLMGVCIYTLTAIDNYTDGPNGLPSVTSEITINGNGATIERSSGGDTPPQFRIFHVASGGNLTLTDLTITNGDAGSNHGGSIYNQGTLNIGNSTLSGNTANFGGGIMNSGGTVDINNSTLSGNTASYGGGICNGGTLNISHSTFSSNTATDDGGGFYSGGTTHVKNTIMAGNTPNNCSSTMTSQGYNLESGTDCGFNTQGKPDDQWNTDPILGLLQDNGGPTWTHALLEGSPAIDAGSCTDIAGNPVTTDQRGYDRPYPASESCDIGAYESEYVPPPTSTPTPTETPSGAATHTPTPTNTPTTDPCDASNLINAINTANGNEGADTIDLMGVCIYTLTAIDNYTDGPNGLPSVTSEITINGNGATIERSSGGDTPPQFRIFHVASGGNLTLTDLTITNGDAGSNHGGSIYNQGTLNIGNSTLSGNTANFGGGIMNSGGTVDINNSTLSGNTASYGGGICNGGTLNISHSTFSSNTATDDGGGFYSGGTTHVKNTIMAGNTPNNCSSTMTSQGYNLESGTDCGFNTQGKPDDQWNTDPILGLLQDNGGPTWTHALLEGSPAIDAGSCTDIAGNPVTTDQRGYDRPYPGGGNCDIGPYEYGSTSCVLFGDLDEDGDVDVQDITLVSNCWHCQSEDGCYDERCDLDKDGDIDIVDIMLVAAHWGDTCG
jgi:hypothetical protein